MVEQNLPTKARSEAGWISVPFQERHWHRSVQVRRGTVPSFSVGYGLYTESAQSRGPENIDPERPPSGLLALAAVLSPTRITLENSGKIRPQPDRENAFAGASGGEEGIRTLETVPRLHTFQACAFDHSATSPPAGISESGGRAQEGYAFWMQICQGRLCPKSAQAGGWSLSKWISDARAGRNLLLRIKPRSPLPFQGLTGNHPLGEDQPRFPLSFCSTEVHPPRE